VVHVYKKGYTLLTVKLSQVWLYDNRDQFSTTPCMHHMHMATYQLYKYTRTVWSKGNY